MIKLMNAIILSYLKTTENIEKKRHCTLNTFELIRLKIHLFLCRNCSNYAKQTAFIDRLLNRQPPVNSSALDTSFLEEQIVSNLTRKS
jgi:hypothetical protein